MASQPPLRAARQAAGPMLPSTAPAAPLPHITGISPVADPSPALVSRDALEALCASIAARTPDHHAGIFGPDSISWKINCESALFLGAGRAALLQLAHPWVAAALERHSNLRNDPLARFHNTFRVVFTMIFGTLDQALAASRHLHQIHTRIRGEIPESVAAYPKGAHYEANEIHALCWVYATLVESALIAYESVMPPLEPVERETYYAESKTMAALFGIPASALPTDWSGFEAYNRSMWTSDALGINSLSREMAHRVMHGRGSWVPVPHWYRALTAQWMPEHLREDFGLGEDRGAAASALEWLPRIYRKLPGTVRLVGPYQEARARLQGRRPGLIIRASNRFWMGTPQTMFSFDKSTGP